MQLQMTISFCLLITGTFHEELHERIGYVILGETANLSCNYNHVSTIIWRRKGQIISDGPNINPEVASRRKYSILSDHKNGEFNLQIFNTTTDDLGDYWCEVQLASKFTQRKVVLTLADTQIDRTSTVNQQETISETKESTVRTNIYYTDSTDGPSTKNKTLHNMRPTMENSTAFHVTTENVKLEVTEKETKSSSEFSSSERLLFYGLLGAGLVLVLTLSIGINICITKTCRHGSVKISGNLHNANTSRGTSQDLETSSQYASICENEMIRNHVINGTVGSVIPDGSSSDKSYLEVIADDFIVHSNQPTPPSGERNDNQYAYAYCDSADVLPSKTITSAEYRVAREKDDDQIINIQITTPEVSEHRSSASSERKNEETTHSSDSQKEDIMSETNENREQQHIYSESYEVLTAASVHHNDYSKLEDVVTSNMTGCRTSGDGADVNEQPNELLNRYQPLISDTDKLYDYTKINHEN